MREDFNKLLVERERFGSHRKFHTVRGTKVGSGRDGDIEIGGRQGMKRPHHQARGRGEGVKQFNENLNPLKGFLRGQVGRPWNKIYSEIRKNFDARSVINNHILEHLFDYVELNVQIVNGKPHVLMPFRYLDNRLVHVSQSFADYFVDPRDGIMKVTKRGETKRRKDARYKADAAAQLAAVKRVIDENTQLHKLNGVWFVIELKDIPPVRVTYERPYGVLWMDWAKLTKTERELKGTRTEHRGYTEVTLHDEAASNHHWRWTRFEAPKGKYFAAKTQASSKVLKEHGLDNGAELAGPGLSHRERSKFR